MRQWQKPRDTWGDVGACASNDDLISNLDPDTDVLLFPLKEATLVEDFAWEADDATGAHEEEGEPNHAPPSSAGAAVRKNLVVLEASWGGGKTMARTIVQRRRRLGLEPIPCVTLPSHVVGKYWKVRSSTAATGLWCGCSCIFVALIQRWCCLVHSLAPCWLSVSPRRQQCCVND